MAQFYTAIAKVGGGVNDAEGFFKLYLAFPVVLFFWLCGYLWKRQGVKKLADIDLDTGRRPIDWEDIYGECKFPSYDCRASLTATSPTRTLRKLADLEEGFEQGLLNAKYLVAALDYPPILVINRVSKYELSGSFM